MSIPHNLKTIRSKYRMSQEAFAQMLNVTRSVISNYEMGQSLPPIELFIQLSALVGIPIDQLFYGMLQEDDLPEQLLYSGVNDPQAIYASRRNLYDVRNLVIEIGEIRKEINEMKKKE